MRTQGLFLALSISILVTNTSAQVAPQTADSHTQGSTAPTAVNSGQALITVFDDSGNAVPAPARDSVRLQINKQPVEIEEILSLRYSPLYFSVLLDISGSSKQFADEQIAAAIRLFAYLSTGQNHGYLILFKSKITTSDRFIDTSSVEEILRGIPPRSRWGPTALYDAIIHAATEQLSSTKVPRNSRRAIFILSDGGDNNSHKSLEQTLKLVRREGIPIFSLGFSPDKSSYSARELKLDLETLRTLSDSTGGFVTFLDQSGDPVRLAASLAGGQCVMLFKPPTLKPNKSYALKIESSVKEIHILAPTEYFAP